MKMKESAMKITETFRLADGMAPRMYWMTGYVALAREIYQSYTQTGETSERARHVSNCAARWGISRRCAEAMLTGECEYTLSDDDVTIIRPVMEE